MHSIIVHLVRLVLNCSETKNWGETKKKIDWINSLTFFFFFFWMNSMGIHRWLHDLESANSKVSVANSFGTPFCCIFIQKLLLHIVLAWVNTNIARHLCKIVCIRTVYAVLLWSECVFTTGNSTEFRIRINICVVYSIDDRRSCTSNTVWLWFTILTTLFSLFFIFFMYSYVFIG